LEQLRAFIHRRFGPHRHTALLVAIISAFAIRPLLGDAGIGPALFSVAILVLLLVALYNINVDELVGERETLLAQRRRRSIIGWVLAVPAIAERLAINFVPNPSLILAGSILWLLLLAFITWNELRGVLKQKEVTGETISMSISVYLLLGLTWGFFYIVLHDVQPRAFSFNGVSTPMWGASAEQHVFPILIYFSLTTLATIGYGDILPVSLQARYAAVAEGITGQFYLAILVARLVGMQMSQSASRRAEPKPHDSSIDV
jgi:hypothetical protein